MDVTQCNAILALSTGEEFPCRRPDEHSGDLPRSKAQYSVWLRNCHKNGDRRWDDATPGARRLRLREGDQPLPELRPDRPAIQDLVIADIERRKQLGLQRYGTLLKAGNGRNALVDAYEECLDMLCYLKQETIERDQSARPVGVHPAAAAD